MGMFSRHVSRVSHIGHRDGGVSTLIPIGSRYTSTLISDPTHDPNVKTKKAHIALLMIA
jgi:hypothetical protein